MYTEEVRLANVLVEKNEVNNRKETTEGGLQAPKLFNVYVEETMSKNKWGTNVNT